MVTKKFSARFAVRTPHLEILDPPLLMTAKTENAHVLPSLPLRPVSQIQFYRLMVPFRVDGHICVIILYIYISHFCACISSLVIHTYCTCYLISKVQLSLVAISFAHIHFSPHISFITTFTSKMTDCKFPHSL